MTRTLSAIIILFILIAPASATDNVNAGSNLDFKELLSGSANEGFERAIGKREFHFPRDHGPHPSFQTEWWYFTGNLEDEKGRKFGYELSLFRFAIDSNSVKRSSKWAAKNVYMGHFALTDAETGRFYSFERFAREGAGLAGSQAGPFKVWVEDWSVGTKEGENDMWKLRAARDGIVVNLLLLPEKGIVLQGDEGFSQKSKEPGNASCYYSIPRLSTKGSIEVNGERFNVAGRSSDLWETGI